MADMSPALRFASLSLAIALNASAAVAAEDLIATRTARSLIAEAALVLRLDESGKVNATYTEAMSEQLAEQLQQIGDETRDTALRDTTKNAIAALKAHNAASLREISD